jgi:hypothetical protein
MTQIEKNKFIGTELLQRDIVDQKSARFVRMYYFVRHFSLPDVGGCCSLDRISLNRTQKSSIAFMSTMCGMKRSLQCVDLAAMEKAPMGIFDFKAPPSFWLETPCEDLIVKRPNTTTKRQRCAAPLHIVKKLSSEGKHASAALELALAVHAADVELDESNDWCDSSKQSGSTDYPMEDVSSHLHRRSPSSIVCRINESILVHARMALA